MLDNADAPALTADLPRTDQPARARDMLVPAGTAGAWAAAAVCVGLVLFRIADGWDLTDESFYLLSSAPAHRSDALNGFAGLYLRPLWVLTGWNVTAVRLVGVLVLLAVAALLGRATARLTRFPTSVAMAVTVAAATGFYASGDRTPGYNWLALVGVALACAAGLRLLDDAHATGWGVVCGLGVLIAAAGKLTTGAAIGLVLVLVIRRMRPLLTALAVLVAGAVLHVLLVLPLDETREVLRRSSAMVVVLDPRHYTMAGALRTVLVGVLIAAIVGLQSGGLMGVLPALARPHPQQQRWFRALTVVAVLAAAAQAVWSTAWLGGWPGMSTGAGATCVLIALGVVWIAGRFSGLARAPRPGAAAGCVLLVLGAVCTIAGSAVGFGQQLVITGLLLAPACLLVCPGLPVGVPRAAAAAVVAAVCLGTLAVGVETVTRQKEAPLVASTIPVRLGPVTAHLDAGSAGRIRAVVDRARAAGWQPGTPFVDVTYTPALPLALGAQVPPVLLPGLPRRSPEPVCQAVRGLGDAWRGAWLLVERERGDAYLGTIAGYLGRRYPQDYDRVAAFDNPYLGVRAVLLRPRADPAPVPRVDGTPPLGCLGAQPAR